ncbi:YqcC family protein [Rheinheimera sp. MMS21-TC3]|uniref:YqcC family protein n=1 Tax=Rheinheimera sp. MMS21-TC3 TaxID=3072790 RepID=UPI0028C459CF|nr:YqcC family protein [Rheinheimera sp. MMS21-TC3]WNO62016.1 YqcC family protein [Rheinheimera sp. MMS21-TC3]
MNSNIELLLAELERELKQLNLWSASPPNVAAMASSAPFCCDTMPLENWLQYIFIPRMTALIAAKAALPNKISVHPIAEEAFKSHAITAQPLLSIIKSLDNQLTGEA